jgi:hypothetical protein
VCGVVIRTLRRLLGSSGLVAAVVEGRENLFQRTNVFDFSTSDSASTVLHAPGVMVQRSFYCFIGEAQVRVGDANRTQAGIRRAVGPHAGTACAHMKHRAASISRRWSALRDVATLLAERNGGSGDILCKCKVKEECGEQRGAVPADLQF